MKKFYRNHSRFDDYKDLNFLELEKRKDIKSKYVLDIINEYEKEIKKIKNNQYNNNLMKIHGNVVKIEHEDANVFSGCKYCYRRFDNICPNCNTYNKKLYFDFNIKIADCSNYIWINFFGETAENFLGISPEDYQSLIKYNNNHKLNKINKRILYHEYTFFIRYINTSSDNYKSSGFIVVQYNKVDKNHFRNVLNLINDEINDQ